MTTGTRINLGVRSKTLPTTINKIPTALNAKKDLTKISKVSIFLESTLSPLAVNFYL